MKKRLMMAVMPVMLASSVWAVHAGADTLAKIKATGTITEGVRESSGLAYTLGNGKYTGFHYDVCANIIADVKKHLGLATLETRYQPVTSQNRVALVQNGTVDLECGSTTNNRARARDVDFAITTFVEEVRMAVKANSGIRELKDLNGKTVVTTTGSTSVQTLRRDQRAQSISIKEVYGKDHADSFLMVESGRADAFVMDGSILAASIAKSRSPKDFRIVGEVLSVEPIAIMLPKGDAAFKSVVDDSIRNQIKSGELGRLYDKWFMHPIPPSGVTIGLPVSSATKNAWDHPNDRPAEDYSRR
ncbi:amino acid ABC transporter substrate-binding protein [Pandoraea anhela]|uniref:Glutamate/aspartate import solute-binding protein n=1 Tax=Pandoraea anhela TaxID=2508295 RepID=A0A5E4RAG4_9BURK|nr:amino acid ABC transporter substrate-binding protein [Pandoraea anhela]VVD59029.1 Glutamate/aspartate import solute-binding protein [Pandoraea anhela]